MLIFDVLSFLALTLIVLVFPAIVMTFDYSIIALAVFSVIFGTGNYVVQRRTKSYRSDFSPRLLRDYNFLELVNAKDELRSRLYSQKFRNITKKNIAIFTFENTGKFPPAFARSTVNGPSVYIDWKFISQLDEKCVDALILHELGHIKHGDYLMKRLLSNLFVLFLAFAALSLVIILLLGMVGRFFFIPVALISISMLSIMVLQLITNRSEISADKFGATILGDSSTFIRTLEEIRNFVSSGSYPSNVASKVDRRITKRIERLKDETP